MPAKAIGIESSFDLQGITSGTKTLATSSSRRTKGVVVVIRAYFHRVIQDERGWVMLVGAGEGTSKSDIASVFGSALGDAIQTKHVTPTAGNGIWKKLGFAVPSTSPGQLLITMDCVLPPYVSRKKRNKPSKKTSSCA